MQCTSVNSTQAYRRTTTSRLPANQGDKRDVSYRLKWVSVGCSGESILDWEFQGRAKEACSPLLIQTSLHPKPSLVRATHITLAGKVSKARAGGHHELRRPAVPLAPRSITLRYVPTIRSPRKRPFLEEKRLRSEGKFSFSSHITDARRRSDSKSFNRLIKMSRMQAGAGLRQDYECRGK